MQIVFIMLSALAGAAVGVLQALMLGRLLKSITEGRYRTAFVILPLKLLLYAAVFVPAVLLLSQICVIALGGGLGLGIMAFAVAYSLLNLNRR